MFSLLLLLMTNVQTSEGSMQQNTVSGKVTDMFTDAPLVGATVMVKGTSTGVKAQKDGTYSINLPADAKTLVFSFSGYQTLQIDIDGRTKIDVTMSKGNSPEESELWD